jgi:3-methyl-2-oxobutanoate hydroxymethyltransferase
MSVQKTEKKTSRVTIPKLQERARAGEKLVMLTCYDASFAKLSDEAGVDMLLIGDSLGMVIQGHDSTLPVTMSEVEYQTRCVVRGSETAFILADMPFGSFQSSKELAFTNAARLMAAGAQMVKLEGGAAMVETTRFLVERGIPVCAHIGLTPQSVNTLGGYRVQGRDDEAAQRLVADARALEAAGADIVLMEAMPAAVARRVTEAVKVPTIGIGAGIDLVLVGDSLGMVIQGHDTTVPVTLQDIIYHCRAVAKGLYRPFLMADMPFMTYASREQALENAVRLMQEGGAKMVKLEGGGSQVEIVEFLAGHDIAVCAHLGLKPQSVHKVGGFRVQGREEAAAEQMTRDAIALQNAGADIVLLECIPAALGASITRELRVPVIGIGAGPDVDGQILVLYDVLDITAGRKPKFSKNFLAGHDSALEAVKAYTQAVKSREYPAAEHCF